MSLASQISSAIISAFQWNDKDGNAYKFKDSAIDANYRLWKPDVTDTPEGGAFVNTKMDHIRGMASDDHAVMTMTYNQYGELESGNVAVQIQGKNEIAGSLGDVLAGLPPLPPKAEAAKAAAIALARAIQAVLNLLEQMTDDGGRLGFPSVIERIQIQISKVAIDTAPNPPTPMLSASNTLYATVKSQPQPLPGQKHRSSNNFMFHGLPSGQLKVTFTDNANADRITCTVMRDVSMGSDPTIVFLSAGTTIDATKFEIDTPYYIADPSGADSTFTVNFNG